MGSDGTNDTTKNERKPGRMSEQRQQRIRLEISREAARLFWEQGVAATTGEQIAAAVGLSVRTLWRYFRNKESCAEPIVEQSVEWFVSVLRSWPRQLSFEEHYVAELAKRPQGQDADLLASRQMIVLAKTEPAIRTAWLMACDRGEREFIAAIANRLQRSTDDIEVRIHAAAATSVLRVISEDVSAAVLTGAAPAAIDDPLKRIEFIVRALYVATGGVVGDPVDP